MNGGCTSVARIVLRRLQSSLQQTLLRVGMTMLVPIIKYLCNRTSTPVDRPADTAKRKPRPAISLSDVESGGQFVCFQHLFPPQCLEIASCPFLLIASLHLHTDKLNLGDGALRSFEPVPRAEGEREEPASKCDGGDSTDDYGCVV